MTPTSYLVVVTVCNAVLQEVYYHCDNLLSLAWCKLVLKNNLRAKMSIITFVHFLYLQENSFSLLFFL